MTWKTRFLGGTALIAALVLVPSSAFAIDSLPIDVAGGSEESVSPNSVFSEAEPVPASNHLTHDALAHGFASPRPLASGDFTEKPADEARGFMYIPEPSTLSIALLMAVGSIPVALRRKWG